VATTVNGAAVETLGIRELESTAIVQGGSEGSVSSQNKIENGSHNCPNPPFPPQTQAETLDETEFTIETELDTSFSGPCLLPGSSQGRMATVVHSNSGPVCASSPGRKLPDVVNSTSGLRLCANSSQGKLPDVVNSTKPLIDCRTADETSMGVFNSNENQNSKEPKNVQNEHDIFVLSLSLPSETNVSESFKVAETSHLSTSDAFSEEQGQSQSEVASSLTALPPTPTCAQSTSSSISSSQLTEVEVNEEERSNNKKEETLSQEDDSRVAEADSVSTQYESSD
jgi:hypothetical protein